MLTLPADHDSDQLLIADGQPDLQDEVDKLARSLRAGFTTVLLVVAVLGLLIAAPLLPHPVFLVLGGFTLCGLLGGPMTRSFR
jgi:hypothetical protein